MSFSFPHLVWIFQKAFSGLGLSYFETLLIDDWCCHYWSSPSESSWCRFRVWRAELWAILSFLLLLPHCIVIPNWDIIIWHIWINEVRCWGFVTHGVWWYLVIQQIPHPDSLRSHSDYSSIHSPTTQESGHCPAVLSLFLIQIHIHTYPRGRHHHHSFHYLPSHRDCFSKPAHCTPTATFSFLIFLCFTASLYTL